VAVFTLTACAFALMKQFRVKSALDLIPLKVVNIITARAFNDIAKADRKS
jgi:hypothetical protein